MPCHCAIDYEDKAWERTQLPSASMCAGSLIFMRNTCKSPRGTELANMVRQVTPDRETVFSHRQEFLEHHNGKVSI